MNLFSKLSFKLYTKFILEKPFPFIAATFIATLPFLLETAGILSFIPLLKSEANGDVLLPIFWSDTSLTLTTQEMILFLVGIFSLQWVFSTAKVFMATSWSNQLVVEYKSMLFESLQQKSPIETQHQNKGVWIQLFQSEFRQLGLAFISSVYLMASLCFSIFTLWLLWKISPELSTILIPLGLLIYLSILISNKLVHRHADSYQREQQNEASFLLENWKHPIIHILHQTQQWMHKNYVKVLNATQHQSYMHLSMTFSAPHWTRWVIFMCILALLAIHYVMPEDVQMDTSTLITYLIVLSRLQPITYTLAHDLANLVTGQVAWKAIQPHLELPMPAQTRANNISFTQKIEIRDLTFQYPDRDETLGPHNFNIQHGETFGLYGPSGSGKSTLMYCLMGIYSPKSGKVLIDENELSPEQLQTYWKIVAYVPQDSDFMQMSLRDNLCLGQTFSDEEILHHFEKLGLKTWLDSLPQRLNETLYPDAKNLSGGQKKKIMMVRALLRQPKLLFLDEPCAGLDDQSKRDWIQTLEQLPETLTTVIITHDSDLLDLCDRVYET